MTMLIPDVGEVKLLDNALGDSTPENLLLKLYTNNFDCVEGSVHTDFTECAIAGYAAKTLTAASWNAASTSAGVTSKTYAQQTFNFTGSGNIVGYYVVGATSGVLYWAERLYATTGQAVVSGDAINVTPKLEAA